MTNPTPATFDFLATWTDTDGNTYQQTIKLADDAFWSELSDHLAWVVQHHAIASYSLTAIN